MFTCHAKKKRKLKSKRTLPLAHHPLELVTSHYRSDVSLATLPSTEFIPSVLLTAECTGSDWDEN